MSNVIEQIAVASELRHRDGRNVVAERIYEQVVMPLEQKLTESERYGRQADITIENLERKVEQLAAENAALKELIEQHAGSVAVCPNCSHEEPSETDDIVALYRSMETPATDAILAEVRASGVDSAIDHLNKIFDSKENIGEPIRALEWLAQAIRQGAAK